MASLVLTGMQNFTPLQTLIPQSRQNGRIHCLYSSSDKFQGTDKTPIRFLGKGERAIVREGAILLSPHNEFHHYYRQSAIFIYSMGVDEYDVFCVRGLIIDHPTPFTLREMIPDERFATTQLGDNLIHRGGDKGDDGVILLHDIGNDASQMIGTSDLYQGGWGEAIQACENGTATPDNFKAFFNYCEFTELEVEDLLKSTEDGDAWISVEVDRKLILSQEWDRGGCWRRLRNAVRDYTKQ